MTDLRCPSRLHGVLVGEEVIEVKCRSRVCGADSETVVLHYFNLKTGTLVETKNYKNPSKNFHKEEEAQCR